MAKAHFSERLARAVAGRLFLPVEADYNRVLGVPLRVLVLLALFGIVALSAPPVVERVWDEDIWPFDSIRASHAVWESWLPFAVTGLEILLALLIGGSVFGEWAAAHSKSALDRLQASVDASRKEDIVDAEDELEGRLRRYRMLLEGITWRNIVVRLWELFFLSRDILAFVVREVPRTNARFVTAKIGVAFPGGFFGLFAFMTFGVLSIAKVLDLYLNRVASGAS